MRQLKPTEVYKNYPSAHEYYCITTYVSDEGKPHYLLEVHYNNGYCHISELYTSKAAAGKRLEGLWSDEWAGLINKSKSKSKREDGDECKED